MVEKNALELAAQSKFLKPVSPEAKRQINGMPKKNEFNPTRRNLTILAEMNKRCDGNILLVSFTRLGRNHYLAESIKREKIIFTKDLKEHKVITTVKVEISVWRGYILVESPDGLKWLIEKQLKNKTRSFRGDFYLKNEILVTEKNPQSNETNVNLYKPDISNSFPPSAIKGKYKITKHLVIIQVGEPVDVYKKDFSIITTFENSTYKIAGKLIIVFAEDSKYILDEEGNEIVRVKSGRLLKINKDETITIKSLPKILPIENTVINFKTKEESDAFLNLVETTGEWKWKGWRKPKSDSGDYSWTTYKEETCINISRLNNMVFAKKEWFADVGCSVITFTKFLKTYGLTKADLKYL